MKRFGWILSGVICLLAFAEQPAQAFGGLFGGRHRQVVVQRVVVQRQRVVAVPVGADPVVAAPVVFQGYGQQLVAPVLAPSCSQLFVK